MDKSKFTEGEKVILFVAVIVLLTPLFIWWMIPMMQNWNSHKEKCQIVAQMPTDEYTGNSARGTRQRLYVNVYECPDGKVKRLIESGSVNYK